MSALLPQGLFLVQADENRLSANHSDGSGRNVDSVIENLQLFGPACRVVEDGLGAGADQHQLVFLYGIKPGNRDVRGDPVCKIQMHARYVGDVRIEDWPPVS